MTIVIETMTATDWPQVRDIYAEGLATGLAAFMSEPPDWPAWDAGHLEIARLVARDPSGRIAGWAALAPVPDT